MPGQLTQGLVLSSPLPCQAGDVGAIARFGLEELICNSGWSSEPWGWEALMPHKPMNP